MLRHLAYVILFVEDFERAVAFYTEVLELPVRHRADGYVELGVEGPKFALLARGRLPALVGPSESGAPPPGTHEGEVAPSWSRMSMHCTPGCAPEGSSSWAHLKTAPMASVRCTFETRTGT